MLTQAGCRAPFGPGLHYYGLSPTLQVHRWTHMTMHTGTAPDPAPRIDAPRPLQLGPSHVCASDLGQHAYARAPKDPSISGEGDSSTRSLMEASIRVVGDCRKPVLLAQLPIDKKAPVRRSLFQTVIERVTDADERAIAANLDSNVIQVYDHVQSCHHHLEDVCMQDASSSEWLHTVLDTQRLSRVGGAL